MKNKTYLCGITYAKETKGIEDNIIPIAKFFDGLNFVVHQRKTFPTLEDYELKGILLEHQGCGEIHFLDWIKRYDFSRNRYLLDPLMKDGDFFVVLDSLERFNPEVCEETLEIFRKIISDNNLDALFLHGKLFMARKNEWMIYQNAVHEQLTPIKRAMEITQIQGFEDSDGYYKNVRTEYREKGFWTNHFARYYLINGSIQCLMGAEGNNELFQSRMKVREEFRKYCLENNIELSLEKLVESWNNGISEEMKKFINSEKILNDLYWSGKGEEVSHDHDFEKIKLVEQI